MAASKPKHGGLQSRTSEWVLEGFLRSRVMAHMSWKEWTDHQRARSEPVLLHRLLALQTDLLTVFGEYSCLVHAWRGAYFPLIPLILRVICSELERGKIEWPADGALSLRMKVSVDGRKLRTNANVAWFISFVESVDAQSNLGHYTFAIADMHEPQLASDGVWAEIGLDEALRTLRTGPLQLGPLVLLIDPFVCADWKCLTYLIGFSPANSGSSARVCGWCHVDKSFLKHRWLKEYAFLAHPVDDQNQVKEIPSLPIWCVRYCAMHGCNRLLDNHLRILQEHTSKAALKDIVREVSPHWGKDGALHPLQMKQFYRRQLDATVARLFGNSQRTLTLPQREAPPIQISLSDAAQRLLQACKCYFNFAYTRTPTPADFTALKVARDNILAIDFALRAPQQPTTHYMTSHFVDFAVADGGAYHSVQEGAEHHHKDDRKDSWMAFTCSGSRYDDRSTLQMMLDNQELQRILIRRAGSV
jgi:hypothetical protein